MTSFANNNQQHPAPGEGASGHQLPYVPSVTPMANTFEEEFSLRRRSFQLEGMDFEKMKKFTKEFVLEWHKLTDISNSLIKAQFGTLSADSTEKNVVGDCAGRIAEGALTIDDALNEIGLNDLSMNHQFEVERFQRAVDATDREDMLRPLAEQVLQACYTQRAAVHWILQQGPASGIVRSDE